MSQPQYNTYIGARYVPIHCGDWNINNKYEPLSIVYFQGDSYISKTFVPTGIDLTNEKYWAISSKYSAQIEAFRLELNDLEDKVNAMPKVFVTPEMYGAVGTGEDATLAFNELFLDNTVPTNMVLTGRYTLSGVTIPENITTIFAGGQITGTSTVTVNGYMTVLKTDRSPFELNTSISMGKQHNGRPEYFVIDSSDWTPAINKALQVFKHVILDRRIYEVASTIIMDKEGMVLEGDNVSYEQDIGTKIDALTNNLTVVRIGPPTVPPTFNDYPRDIVLKNLAVSRVPRFINGAVGVHIYCVLQAIVKNVESERHADGFKMTGAVYTKLYNCRAFAPTIGAEDNSRIATGFRIDNSVNIGAAGGNASVYIDHCSARFGGVVYENSCGYRADGGYGPADLYITNCEAIACDTGIYIDAKNNQYANGLMISNCVVDQFTYHAYDIRNLIRGMANLVNNYAAPAGLVSTRPDDAQVMFYLDHAKGCICTSNQMLGTVAAGTTRGFQIITCESITATNNMIKDCDYGYEMTDSYFCEISGLFIAVDPMIFPATLTRCTANKLQIFGSITAPVACNLTSSFQNSIDVTALNRTNITQLISIDSQDPPSNGYFNNNFITGYFKPSST